jgi:hypothetical protein
VFADLAEDFAEPGLDGALGAKLLVELVIGRDQSGGPMNDEGYLINAISLLGQEDHPGEGGDVVFNGAQGVVKGFGDFLRFLALKEEADRLDAMGLAWTDVLLLAAGGDLQVASPEGGDIADDGADAAIEETKSEVLIGE